MTEKQAEEDGEEPSKSKSAVRSLTKLNMRRTVLVTLPFMGALTFWQAYDGLVPLMFKNTFGMEDTLTGVFMSLDNVLALFMLPLMGALSDRTTTRWGRRTPFIVVGALLAAALTPLIAVANAMRFAELPLNQVAPMASTRVADSLHLTDRGRIRAGLRADLCLLDSDLKTKMTVVGGKILFER